MQGINSYTIDSPDWGPVHIARVVPTKRGGPWGVLAPLRGTPWEDFVSVVSGDDLSHAVRGHATPLMNTIGRPPEALLRLIPIGKCPLVKSCISSSKDCVPGKKTPDCYEAPVKPGIARLVTFLVLAWRDSRYVVVVEGREF